MTKSWRKSSTGKIWSIEHIRISKISSEQIGTKITCGMCGKKAEKGYHLTIRRTRDQSGQNNLYDYNTFNPTEALLGLEFFQMDEFRDTSHWFVNTCCHAQFRLDCFDLGFKIDRIKTPWVSRRSLNQLSIGNRNAKRRRR